MRSRRWLPIALTVALAACRRPTHDECVEVVGRYVDMRAGDDVAIVRAPESARESLRVARAAETRKAPLFEARVAQCEREVSRSALECGRAAPGPNEWEACFE